MPTSIHFRPYTKARSNARTRIGLSWNIATKELLLHSSEHPKLDYTAREEELGGTDALLKHYVGVYDPETGNMELMEARKMVLRGSVRAQQATVEDEMSMVGSMVLGTRLTLLMMFVGHARASQYPWSDIRYKEGKKGNCFRHRKRHLPRQICEKPSQSFEA